jgi:hypothetical protein
MMIIGTTVTCRKIRFHHIYLKILPQIDINKGYSGNIGNDFGNLNLDFCFRLKRGLISLFTKLVVVKRFR